MKNPYQRKNKWYFFNESFEEYGPFKTRDDAKKALQKYSDELG